MLKAGTSLTDISPQKGIALAGYPHCPRYNTGVHDPLYAACLYLNNGRRGVVIVTLDLLYIGKRIVKRLREKIGVDIMFCTSHTHSGPWASTPLASEIAENIYPDEEYVEGLFQKLELTIWEAMKNTFDAQIGTNIGYCGAEQGVGGNRRTPGGVCDPSVNVLAVRDAHGIVRACMLNYTLHPTFLHAESTVVSADYPAYVRRYLEFAFPEAVFLFSQGTSGDQSSRYHRVGQDFEEAARVGTTLGVAVFNCFKNIQFISELAIEVYSTETELPMRLFLPLEQAEQEMWLARQRFADLDDSDYIAKRNAELAMFGAENNFYFSRMAREGALSSDELPCEIQAIRLGDTLLTGIQGELFVEYGLKIKELSQFEKTFVCSVTNGSLPGYIYTPEAGKAGGYETGTSAFSDQAGDTVIRAFRDLQKLIILEKPSGSS